MRKYTADTTQNCLQCCLALMFDKDMEDIPTVHEWSKKHDYWFVGMYNWSTIHMGHIPVSIVDDTLDDIFHIAVIREQGAQSHAVVAHGTEVIWDPKPTGKIKNLLDIAEWEYSLIFISVDDNTIQSRLLKEYRHGKQGTVGQP